MSLKLIPLHLDFIFNFDNMILAIVNVKIPIIMPCYDFIVKFQNFDLTDLFGPYGKGDERYISSISLKMLMTRPSMKNNLV